jgi:hypothetical protein
MFFFHISNYVAHALSSFSFVLGLIREYDTYPLILGIFVISCLSNGVFGGSGVGCETSILGLCLLKCFGVNNNEVKLYASSIFIGGN